MDIENLMIARKVMENKKTPKADLENKKSIFFETGLIVALATVLFAFEWKSSEAELSDFITVSEIPTELDVVPITVMNQLPAPPPPTIKPFDLLTIVEELEDVNEELELTDVTDDSENPEQNFNPSDLNYDEINTGEEVIFVYSEEMPVFPGNVQKWIAKNVRYPALAETNGIEGKVYVKFVIERDGSVSNIEVVRSADSMLDKEAIRVISAMPKWKPGKQRSKAVRVSYTLPITFRLSR